MTYIKSRKYLALAMLVISVFVFLDIYEDFTEGAHFSHLLVEATILLISSAVFLVILAQYQKERTATQNLKRSLKTVSEEREQLRSEIRQHMSGLSQIIDSQFDHWNLTPTEKDVGFLLLKGLSLKEIAAIRETAEKTTHTQVQAIYKKSGIHGRSEFAAYFLEDLLPSSETH